jgi:hypothetical protein
VQERLSLHHISGDLRLEEIAEPGEILELDEIQEQTSLLIDGDIVETRVSQGFQSGTMDVRPIKRAALGLGEHTATIRVRRTSGQVLAYSWTFTVLAEEPTLPGLPEGLQFVRPLPDSTITVQAYQEERLVPPYYAPFFADLRGGVCAGIFPAKVVAPDESPDEHDVAKKYSFIALDGVPPGEGGPAVIRAVGPEHLEVPVYDETEHIIAFYVGSHHYKCWQVDLAPGKHEATIQLRNALGEVIDYTWAFTITNN